MASVAGTVDRCTRITSTEARPDGRSPRLVRTRADGDLRAPHRRCPTTSPRSSTSTSSAPSVWTDAAPADPSWPSHVVGVLDGAVLVRRRRPGRRRPERRRRPSTCYGYHGRAGEEAWLAAGRAVQLVEWGRTHRFCGRCGTPTEPAPGERAMRCPACGLSAFPRLAPAMITLVTRGDDGPDQEALLARGVQWKVPMYSCLAGFVEPGESLEGAVVREVQRGGRPHRRRRALPGQPAVAVPAQPDDRLPRPLRRRATSTLDPTEIADAGVVPPRRRCR